MLKRSILAAGALLCSANLLAQTDIRQGLVAYWPLDTVVDVFGDGTTFTTPELVAGQDFDLIGMDATAVVEGRRANALNFNGTSQHAVRYHDLSVDTGLPIYRNRAFTVSFWVKATLPRVNDTRVFAEANHVSGSIAAHRNPLFNIGTHNTDAANSGALDLYIRNDANAVQREHIKSTAQPYDGNWHHVVYTDNNGDVTLYVDGVADATNFDYTKSTLTLLNTTLAAIQRDNVAARFAGALDDVALWERILSQAEVTQLFENGIVTPIPPQSAFFTQQPPATSTTSLGHRVTFTATAVGTRPLTYQWFRGETPIEGATISTLTINNVLASDAGSYRLQATTPGGSTFSEPVVLTVQADPAPDVRAGLLNYWPLNSGTTTTPDLYSGNDMQLVNMDASNFIAGQRGQALTFNVDPFTADEYAFRTTGSPISQNPNFSVAFWVRAPLDTNDRRIFSEASTSDQDTLFNLGTASNANGVTQGLDVFIRNDDGGVPVNHRRGQRTVFDGNWHHVTWVDANGAARLYVDGVLDPTDFTYTRGTITPNTTSLAAIFRTGPSAFFTGDIDEVAAWNRALTYTEIQEIFNTGVPAPAGIIPAAISVQPVGANLYQGDRIILSADATGTAPLEFQWLKDGQPIPGATSRTLFLSNVQVSDTGSYQLRVRNAAPDAALSNPAQVNVTAVTGLTTALISYWPLNELTGAGPLLTPDVVNGNHLTAVNIDASNLVEGHAGNALTFNGTDEYLVRYHEQTPSVGLPFSVNRAFTVSYWVNALEPAGVQDRRMVSEGSTTSNNPLFNIGTDNTANVSSPVLDIFIRYRSGGNPVNHRKTTLAALDGTWHHVTYVDNNGTVQIYVDGVLEPTTDFNYTRGVMDANITSFAAIVRAAVGSYWTGTLDEIAVWGRALSEIEVLNLFANGPQSGGGGSINIAGISLAGSNLRIAVDSTIDPANLKVQSISDVTASNWTDVAVTWTTEGNQRIATFPAPAGNRFFRVVGTTAPPTSSVTVVYQDNFEAQTTWTHGGEGDSWERGTPVNGPGVAFSGSNAFGTDLDAAYAPNTIQFLRSPIIDLTGVTAGRISWMEWRDMETGDLAEVTIRDADNPEIVLAGLGSYTGTRASWARRSFVIPAEALNRRIILDFTFTSDGANTLPRPGWFIDDVQVVKTNP